jgi:ribosomal protein L30/L7E
MLRKGLTGKQEMRKRKVLQSLDLKKIRDEIIAEDANMKVKDHTLTR